jgi:hypothetical protein
MVLPKRGGLVALSNLADRCGIAAKYRNIVLRSSEITNREYHRIHKNYRSDLKQT